MDVEEEVAHFELIERLRRRRAEILERLERVRTDRRRAKAPLDPDFEEQAVELENDEVLDVLDDVERRELEAIEAALRRIDAGSFGICDDCGEAIEPRRLEVHPEASRCIACEQAREARLAREGRQ